MSEQPGFLQAFANRWEAVPAAVAVVPFDRFVSGRIPTMGDPDLPIMPGYLAWPAISVLAGGGRNRGRSDRKMSYVRVVSVHIWCDSDRLEEHGETAAEYCRQIYANQQWSFWAAGVRGEVTDVIDGGPPVPHQIVQPTYEAWEVVKLFHVHYELPLNEFDCCESDGSSSSYSSSESSGSHTDFLSTIGA